VADYVQRYSDAQAEEFAKRIEKVYAQAAKEVKQKMKAFEEAHKKRDAKMQQQVKDGTITKAQYQQWMAGQVFQGEQWKRRVEDITDVYVNADAKAREILGGTTKNVFAEAANYTAYDIEKNVKGSIAFNTYDRKTVERMIKDDPQILPEWKINEKKDYDWNYKRVNNAVTQGIIQGDSVYDIGKRLTVDLSAKNASKMDMFARTAITGAQNAGRVERLKEVKDMGVHVKKKWLVVHDNRVRDAHADLDGVEAEVDEPFHNEFGDIDYPGDPSADPANVYNCRCSLIYVYPKYEQKETHHFESYAEWKERNKNP
jgi:hypothetical protein